MVHEIENFFGVYCLYCINPRFKGRTYIGFTVDPNRRVKQHNTGKHAGGAWRTHGRGPWDMVMIVHGFPNMISALRFEWAWQNPDKSRRLRHITGKRKGETPFQFRFRVVCEMLQCGPWTRLPLTFRWLKQEYRIDFDPSCMPPKHIPIAYGPVKPVQVKPSQSDNTKDVADFTKCAICHIYLKTEDARLCCVSTGCKMEAHTMCLANLFLHQEVSSGHMLPIDGQCPVCKQTVLWGDLIRLKNGCYQNQDAEADDGNHWVDELQSQVP